MDVIKLERILQYLSGAIVCIIWVAASARYTAATTSCHSWQCSGDLLNLQTTDIYIYIYQRLWKIYIRFCWSYRKPQTIQILHCILTRNLRKTKTASSLADLKIRRGVWTLSIAVAWTAGSSYYVFVALINKMCCVTISISHKLEEQKLPYHSHFTKHLHF